MAKVTVPDTPSRVANETRGTTVATTPATATSFLSRGRGLMFRSAFLPGEALIINPCSSIHMFFMRFPIDVLYMDSEHNVVRAQSSIKPWRIGPLHTKHAKYVIELPAGTISASGTQVGDKLLIT